MKLIIVTQNQINNSEKRINPARELLQKKHQKPAKTKKKRVQEKRVQESEQKKTQQMKITQSENPFTTEKKNLLEFLRSKQDIGLPGGSVSSVVVTSDIKWVVSGSADRTIEVWDIDEKKFLHRFEKAHLDTILSVTVTSDKKLIVSGSADKSIGIWDIGEKTLLHRFEQAHSGQINSVAVTSDNKCIVSGSDDMTIGVWDIGEKKLLHRFEQAHSGPIWSVTVTSNNEYIVSAGGKINERTIAVWDIDLKELFHRFKGHSDEILSIVVSSDSSLIVSGSKDKSIQVRNIEQKRLTTRFEAAHFDSITSVAVTSDNKYIVSCSKDKSIGVWDNVEKKLLHRFEQAHSDEIIFVAVTSDNKYILSGARDNTIGVWDINPTKLLHRFEQVHSGLAWSVTPSSGNKYVVSIGEDITIGIWDIGEKKLLHRFEQAHSDQINSVAMTSDNKCIVSGSDDKSIGVWDFCEKVLLYRFEQAHSGQVNSVAVTSDNKCIVSGSDDMTIGVWDIGEKKLLHRFEQAHSGPIWSVTVTSNNKYIVSGSHDQKIGVWDMAEKKLFHKFEQAHTNFIISVAVTSDNKYIVSGAYDKAIGIWDIGKKKLLHRFGQAHSGSIRSVKVTSDNKYIVSGSTDQSIGLWDIGEKKLLYRFEKAHSAGILSVAVTSDNKYIVSTGVDCTIAVWKISGLHLSDITFLPSVNHIINQIKHESSSKPTSLFASIILFPQYWNALNFIIFMLPDSAFSWNLDFIIENKVYLTLDKYGLTQLEYLIIHNKDSDHSSHLDIFTAYFFKKTSSLLNFNSLNRLKIGARISKTFYHIFQNYGELNFLAVFNGLYSKEIIQHHLDNLPKSGILKHNQSKAFVLINGLWAKKLKKVIYTARKGVPSYTLAYHMMLYSSSYKITDPSIRELLKILSKIESNQLLSSATQTLIDFLWKKSKKLLWLKCAFHGAALAIFTSFAVTKDIDVDVASKLLITVDVLVGILVLQESLHIISDFSSYFGDFWNYLDMLLFSAVIVISALFWTESSADALSFFVSTAILLFFTKILLSFRVIDPLRNLIRMIKEVLRDMGSFLIVITVYLVAFSIVFFQTRRANSDNSFDFGTFSNDLMEMFYLIFTGGSSTEYSGVMIPFYILVTVFQCLVLLNLIISIIGDTFGRVKDNFDIIDLRERVAMLLEIAEEADLILRLAQKVVRRIKRGLWFRRRAVVDASEGIETSEKSDEGKFLMAIEKFEVADESKDASGIDGLKSEISTIKSVMEGKIASMESEMKSKLSTVSYEINNLKDEMKLLKKDMTSEFRSLLNSIKALVDNKSILPSQASSQN